jgi:hypothetical protein
MKSMVKVIQSEAERGLHKVHYTLFRVAGIRASNLATLDKNL